MKMEMVSNMTGGGACMNSPTAERMYQKTGVRGGCQYIRKE